MMFHFPYFSIPYYNRYSRYGYRYPYYNVNPNYIHNSINNKDKNIGNNVHCYKNTAHNMKYNNNNINTCSGCNNNTNTSINFNSIESEEDCSSSSDSPLFQLFGINLYFDDILLICLIWFLYDEGVKDEGLFMALILLLLS